MPERLRIGVAGLGTVGCGLVDLIARNAGLVAERTGRAIEVTAVAARDRARPRPVDVGTARWVSSAEALATDPEVDVVCELIGGSDGPALALARAVLGRGRHLVTANKALLAHHGEELALLAEQNGAALLFEAAVAGGIPIVKALREGLAGNRIRRVYGILNGTSNFILTAMSETGRDFESVLAEAQALGYAEADPSFDVDGIDAAHKLALLAALAFGGAPRFDAVNVEGIRHVTASDIALAAELGYRIKLIGTASLSEEGLDQRVHPAMVPKDAPIAQVEGVLNAVVVEGDAVGALMLEGRGAGAAPTASAVLADLVDIARGTVVPTFGVGAARLARHRPVPLSAHRGAFYIRLLVVDRPGVLADIAAVLRDRQVSVESLIQRARDPGREVPIVLTTHEVDEAALREALDRIGLLEAVLEPPRMIRIERPA